MRTSELKGGVMLRFRRFHVPVAAERPASPFFLSLVLCGCSAPKYTDTLSSLSYTHGRYAIIGRFFVRDR